MEKEILNPVVRMTESDFQKMGAFIYAQIGINLSLTKKVMVESRLQRRLKATGLPSFKAYFDFVTGANGKLELIEMIDVITTNKTDFFREPHHFEFLSNHILPAYLPKRAIRIWSAGCSSGEEPYTLAMVAAEFVSKVGVLDYHITSTDISTEVLRKGMNAIYGMDRVACIPYDLKSKYLLKSKEAVNPTVRIAPHLRKKVSFERLNFMDENYGSITGIFDVIFCRNAIIYFDRKTQEQVINKLCKKLNKGGFLFLGHSESINDFDVPLEQVRPTIFRKL